MIYAGGSRMSEDEDKRRKIQEMKKKMIFVKQKTAYEIVA